MSVLSFTINTYDDHHIIRNAKNPEASTKQPVEIYVVLRPNSPPPWKSKRLNTTNNRPRLVPPRSHKHQSTSRTVSRKRLKIKTTIGRLERHPTWQPRRTRTKNPHRSPQRHCWKSMLTRWKRKAPVPRRPHMNHEKEANSRPRRIIIKTKG